MWKEGAIISNVTTGYTAIEDIWDKVPLGGEYISARIVEHPDNSVFFERVYQDSVKGSFYRTADQLREAYNKSFKA